MMSSNWFTLAVLLLSLPALGVLVFGTRLQVRRQYRVLAERFGSDWTALAGTFRGRSLRITETVQRNGTVSRVEVALSARLDGRILIHHRKRAPRSMLKNPISTGHGAFDRTYVVNATSREIVEKVLTPKVILAFASWLPTMKAAVAAGGVEFSGRDFSYSDGRPVNSQPRRLQFENAVHMLSQIGDLLERSLNQPNQNQPNQNQLEETPQVRVVTRPVRRFDHCPDTPVNVRALDPKFH